LPEVRRDQPPDDPEHQQRRRHQDPAQALPGVRTTIRVDLAVVQILDRHVLTALRFNEGKIAMNLNDLDHLAPEPDRQFVSVGFIGQLLQILPGQLRVLMEESDIKFALVLDGVGYLSVADAATVAAKCRDVRQEIHDSLSAAKRN
jgi:hypothetical protein